ncbi:hypothetical protein NVP2275O_135 [Vibrio phage 2.275.O._10N.286.54.E11]|nr:hypothetical protein NVP2275O_135 [Vibrio phage 2.275.O._10N.286.54.E11]
MIKQTFKVDGTTAARDLLSDLQAECKMSWAIPPPHNDETHETFFEFDTKEDVQKAQKIYNACHKARYISIASAL